MKSAIGFSAEVDHQLAQVAQLETSQKFQKYILLLIDEMYVREELVYRKNTGTLVGFMNMGDINTHLLAFERSLKQDTSKPQLATTIVMFMVQGLFTQLSFPYAQFPIFKCNRRTPF